MYLFQLVVYSHLGFQKLNSVKIIEIKKKINFLVHHRNDERPGIRFRSSVVLAMGDGPAQLRHTDQPGGEGHARQPAHWKPQHAPRHP